MAVDRPARPGPLQWLWYALGGGLAPRYRDWVLRDTTAPGWWWRQIVRALVQAAPVGLVVGLFIPGSTGIRLLAVTPAARGRGVGKALTHDCIERARALGRSSVVLHTTRAMETAWRMYEQLAFRRSPDLDFRQGALEVFGFELPLG